MENLGLRLRLERKRLGLSQQSFGKIGGVEPNAQGKYESGERSPRADYLQKISAAGVDTQYVLNGTSGGASGCLDRAIQEFSMEVQGSKPIAAIISLLAQLNQNLHLTAQSIADVVNIFAPTGSVECRGELEILLRALHADSNRFVEVAMSRANLPHSTEKIKKLPAIGRPLQ